MKNATKLAAAALVVGLLTGCFSDLDDKNEEIIRARLESIHIEVNPSPVKAGEVVNFQVTIRGKEPLNYGIWWNIGGPPLYAASPSMAAPSKPGTYNYSVRLLESRLNLDLTKPFQVTVVP